MDITQYNNELEKKYYFARNNETFLCGCGKFVMKSTSLSHFRTKKHIDNNKDFFCTPIQVIK